MATPDQTSPKGDDGRGAPAGSDQKTTALPRRDLRQVPGGSLEAAKTPIGINAVDRDMLASGGVSDPGGG